MADAVDISSDEIWKPVPGWFGEYEVSSDGRVRSLARLIAFKGRWGPSSRFIAPREIKLNEANRYLGFTARRVGQKVFLLVHRACCEAFHGPAPSPQHQVAHRDGDRRNNRADNLRWATPVENNADKKRHGTYTTGDRHNRTKLPDSEVARLRAGDRVLAARMAREYGMSEWYLRYIQDGKLR